MTNYEPPAGFSGTIAPSDLQRLRRLSATRPREGVHWTSFDRRAVATVVILGGGTAGYMTALALRRLVPGLAVTLVESPDIPVIGVGESTVPFVVHFLHTVLGLDVAALFAEVCPTWKMGIRFEWGRPAPYHFLAPFDWATDSVGIVGSLQETRSPNAMSVQALLMDEARVPVFEMEDGSLSGVMGPLPMAYHLNNAPFVAFLRRHLQPAGVRHLYRNIQTATRDSVTGDVRALVDSDGQEIGGDLFVDCSGFRSQILGQVMRVPLNSYQASLSTDRALVFELSNGGHPKPYTTATTAPNGWVWSIPMRDVDHHGYVYSSSHCSDADAEAEVRRTWNASPGALVRFSSGRHETLWTRNVVAIGNAAAFVEPLESTALLMLCHSIALLSNMLRTGEDLPRAAESYNKALLPMWDGLRWFLALHYKHNQRMDTPFWQDMRRTVDTSGLDELVTECATNGPLRLRERAWLQMLERKTHVVFYGVPGIETILLGSGIGCDRVVLRQDDLSRWRDRRDWVLQMVRLAMTQETALARPESVETFARVVRGVPDARSEG